MIRGSLTAYIYDSLDHFGRGRMLADMRKDRLIEISKGIRKVNSRARRAISEARHKAEKDARTNYGRFL